MKMIQGGRALAAALGGADVYVKIVGGWRKSRSREAAAKWWRKAYDNDNTRAGNFAVRADDARRVLG